MAAAFAAAAGAQEDCPAAQIVKVRAALEPPPPPPLLDVVQPAGGGDGGLKTMMPAVALGAAGFSIVVSIIIACIWVDGTTPAARFASILPFTHHPTYT